MYRNFIVFVLVLFALAGCASGGGSPKGGAGSPAASEAAPAAAAKPVDAYFGWYAGSQSASGRFDVAPRYEGGEARTKEAAGGVEELEVRLTRDSIRKYVYLGWGQCGLALEGEAPVLRFKEDVERPCSHLFGEVLITGKPSGTVTLGEDGSMEVVLKLAAALEGERGEVEVRWSGRRREP